MNENGITTLSTTTAPVTRVEMLNENRNVSNSENTQHNTYDGYESELVEDSRITVTKDLFLCRICYNCDQIERFISPCDCKGSLYYVHKQCLERWLSRAGILHCELCMFRFRTKYTLRYSCCQAIRLWYKHPNHRGLMQSDAMLCTTLTAIILGLLAIVCFGLEYFIPEGQEDRFSERWMRATTIALLVVSLMAYLLFVIFMIRQQLCPFYRWWRSSRIVRVILPDVINKNNFNHQELSKI
ncbi:E3 ubiquitin-protein ligase MARCHF2 isoform X1 [Bradysia coprophila]|uniref:E3 ubiquitin-protein ligase MARCHF2 isoform X1 n=1 Tax=Bradysia coprophila TaxID=38358 RepID=UPI00187D89CF|nr:E3 ubiquitin-protein ligase MARCHF2 isoform X1 [Bradysia coprophila]